MTWGPTSFPAKNHSSKVWQFSTSLAFFAALTKGEESVTFHLPAAFFAFFFLLSRSLQSRIFRTRWFLQFNYAWTLERDLYAWICIMVKYSRRPPTKLYRELLSQWLHLRDIAFGASFLSSRGFSVSWSRDQQYHLYIPLPQAFKDSVRLHIKPVGFS